MKRFFLLILCWVYLGACAGTPTIIPLIPIEKTGKKVNCKIPFPQSRWQFVHTVRIDVGKNNASFFNGVIDVDPLAGSVRCTLLTLEGLVLLDARLTDEPEVLKAVPPFDRQSLSTGILTDVGLIFLQPKGPIVETGRTEAGDSTCRYIDTHQGIVEVIVTPDRSWRIRKDDGNGRMIRRVVAGTSGRWESGDTLFIPDTFTLTAPGRNGYRLRFRLLSSTQIDS